MDHHILELDTDISEATVVTLYLLTRLNLKLRPKLMKELKPGTRIVSHAFDMGDWKPSDPAEIKHALKLVYYKLEIDGRLMYEIDMVAGIQVIDGKDQLHFIDLGRGGIADRWLDIAFIHRNLREDISPDAADIFLEELGVRDEPVKREFFEQLDELF